MKQNRCVLRKPVQELTAETSPQENHKTPHGWPARHWCGTCRDNAEFADAILAAGLESELTGPLTHKLQTGDGEAITEALTLVGTVRAPASARERLERAGIDLRFASHRPGQGRWVRCLFSEAGVDRLLDQMAQGTFPYPFHAASSIGARLIQAQREGQAESTRIPALWFLVTDFGGRSAQGSRAPGSGAPGTSQNAWGVSCNGHSLRSGSDAFPGKEKAGPSANIVAQAGGAQS